MRRLLLLAVLATALLLAGYRELHAPVRAPGAPEQTLNVPAGASVDAIGRQLRALGLVRHPWVFRAWVLVRGDGARLRAGEFALEGPLSLDQIVDMLVRGDVVHHEITFPEGKTLEDMAVLAAGHGLAAAAFSRAARDPAAIRDLDPLATDLEGYLFPDTYELAATPEAAPLLVARMVQRFRDVVSSLRPPLAASGLTLREAVTLASIVEAETAQSLERPRVAAVFLNRLRKGMPLQTDPTVIYALRRAGSWDGNIRKKDLDVDSPYNTYRHAGLPPGPIGNPGRESLQAVLQPAKVEDLYFVSRNDGSHEFSQTLAEHERAVDRYQRHRAPLRRGT